MRKLDTSNISDTVAMPVKSGTLDHLQFANQEVFNAIGRQLVGTSYDAAKVYIVYGCVNSTPGGSTFTISAGCVFYAGEFYLVDAVTFTAGGGQTAVATIATSYNTTNADPVLFSDSVSRNVHQIRKVVVAAANTGTGIADYGFFVRIKSGWQTSTSAAGATISGGGNSITSLDTKWKEIDAGVILNVSALVVISTIGLVTVSIPLPVNGISSPTEKAGFFALDLDGGTGATVYYPALGQREGADKLVLYYISTVANGGNRISGQIIYEK